MSAIAVHNLEKRYGAHAALQGVSFAIEPGETVAMLGPNGAGKTTTVEVLEGFTSRTAGEVRVLGEDPERAGSGWRSQIGLVLQSTSLDDELTVGEALDLYAGFYPRPRPRGEVLDFVDLAPQAGVRIGQLSGGQKRRVDLALGIIGRPHLLFLDEPTTGLDPAARRQTWQMLERLREEGLTLLLTTHYLEEAQRLAGRVIVLAGGRIVAEGAPDAIGGAAVRQSVISFSLPAPLRRGDLPAGLAAQAEGSGASVTLRTTEPIAAIGALLDWARAGNLDLPGLTVTRPTLEDVYLSLTEHAA